VNRAEIVTELEQIRALLNGAGPELLDEVRRRLEVLGERVRTSDLPDSSVCPFEPGTAQLVGMQFRRTPASIPAMPVPKSATPTVPSERRSPLTGRIAAMVRDGVSTEEIIRLYRIRSEHVAAFIAAYIAPAIRTPSAGEVTSAPAVR
jgi:hypothetical protein